MIDVRGLTKRYAGRTAVEDLTFQVDKGEIVGFLGPNGAGKTTTLRMITGYLAPSAGSIQVDGIDALAEPLEARRRIGYMPEGVPLYPEMRVSEYLRHRAELKGVPRRERAAHVERALELAAVAEARDRIVGQLSKGFRQRVGLADALVADPPLLILDEPTSGLDPNQIREVRRLVRELAGDKTVLVSTHILPEVEATCERVLILNRGRIAGQGTPGTLRAAMHGAQEVTLVVRGGEERIRGAFGAVSGVRAVAEVRALEDESALYRVCVETDPDPTVAEALFLAAVTNDLILRELRTDAPSLEDVFEKLTTVDLEEPQGDDDEEGTGTSEDEPDEEGST